MTIGRALNIRNDKARHEDSESEKRLALFEELFLPYLDAAYNLARWLTRNETDAQDIVQEAYLRALGYFDTYRGGDQKAWLFAVLRNTYLTWRSRNQRETGAVAFDEFVHTPPDSAPDYEGNIADQENLGILRNCLDSLSVEFREMLVMRELEEMSYKEIAAATGLPIGTVMSRLSRARKRLEECAASKTTGAAG